MTISGPFRDPARKAWYLLIGLPKRSPDGSPVLRGGKSVIQRWRPYYPTRAKALADIDRIKDQHDTAGSDQGGVLTRQQAVEFNQAKNVAPEVSLIELARFWRLHHPETTQRRLGEWQADFYKDVEGRLGHTRHWDDLRSRIAILCRTFGEGGAVFGFVPGDRSHHFTGAFAFEVVPAR